MDLNNKNMKKQSIFILALFIGVVFTGCDDLLDLEPQASISDQIALSTPGNVQTAIIGGYQALGQANAYGGMYIYLTEVYAASSTEMNWNGTFIQPGEVYNKQILTTNSYMAAYWATSYNIINRANFVLEALDVFGSDAAGKARAEAEARFLRGIALYNLVQVYGKAYNDGNPASNPGVPVVLTPTRTVNETLQVPRNTVAEVYAQVLADLTAARDALPVANGFYANTFTASAFLTRVHLAMGNYAAAGAEANRVITSNRYSLFANIADNFNRTNAGSETIFATQVTPSTGANDMTVFHAPTPTGRADIQVLNGHMAQYESGDARATLFVETGRGRMTTKYATARRNITVIRLAEMHLVRAEANFRLTGSGVAGIGGVTPEQEINAIRARVGLAPLASVTLADILKERKLELIFEGVLYLDLKRNQGTTSSVLTPSIPWNSDRLVFPIPNREMLVNPNLVQNPGYGS
jgi:hypothetical protein